MTIVCMLAFALPQTALPHIPMPGVRLIQAPTTLCSSLFHPAAFAFAWPIRLIIFSNRIVASNHPQMAVFSFLLRQVKK